MKTTVSITRQGQLTIPKHIRHAFGIHGAAKATVRKDGDNIVVRPKKNFWKLSGSLRSRVRLSDKELKRARSAFAKQWPKRR